jgi:hypothetical protein
LSVGNKLESNLINKTKWVMAHWMTIIEYIRR